MQFRQKIKLTLHGKVWYNYTRVRSLTCLLVEKATAYAYAVVGPRALPVKPE